jgi:hypothetical protein
LRLPTDLHRPERARWHYDGTARSKGLPTDDELVNQQLIDILRVAGRFRVGAVLEKGGTEVRARDEGYLETQR